MSAMEHKTFSVHALISLFFLQLLLQHALASASNTNRKASPLEFFKQFQGTRKGDKVKGINPLKKHLHALGYLNNHVADDDDNFDEALESAIKTYQLNFNLDPTGILDLNTVSTMGKPRCGVPDIINGTTRMHNHNNSSSISFHSHYVFFEGNPKWPANKEIISYAFPPGTRADVQEPVLLAFLTWRQFTPFSYILVQDYDLADVRISFQRRDHGDGAPFDGPGNTLAHAFAPPDGRLHYDGDENWVVGAVPGAVDMQTVALHELGHVLGLAHSPVQTAIMYPLLPVGGTKGLNDDDIQGIQALYATNT